MRPFCETIVQDILPAVRAIVARDLMDKHGFTQKDVAERLSITQAAVSQYMRQLRGYRVKLIENDEHVSYEVHKLADRVASSDFSISESTDVFYNICKMVRNKNIVPELSSEEFRVVNDCNVCSDHTHS